MRKRATNVYFFFAARRSKKLKMSCLQVKEKIEQKHINVSEEQANSAVHFYSKTDQMHQCIKFILFWNNSTCCGRSFRPSSGVHDWT